MSTFHKHLSRCLAAAFVIAAGALLHMAVAPGSAAAQAPAADRTARAAALPRVADLPSDFQPVGDIAGRGTFHAAGGQRTYRKDDGSHYHHAGPYGRRSRREPGRRRTAWRAATSSPPATSCGRRT